MPYRLLTAAAVSFSLASVASAQTAPATRATPATPAAPATSATPAEAAAPAAAPTGDLVATAQAAGTFTTLLKAADLAKLTPVLKSQGPITVFAPTDAAFAALPAGELDRLMASPAQMQKLLLAHVVNTKVLKSQIAGTKGAVQNGAGANLQIDGSGEAVRINGATITQADVLATNGVIHVIDKVILPAVAVSTPAGAAAATAATPGASGASTPQPAASTPTS